jgi:hypothetical protein
MLKNQPSNRLQKQSAKSKQEQPGTVKKYTAESVRAELVKLGLGKSCLPLPALRATIGGSTCQGALVIRPNLKAEALKNLPTFIDISALERPAHTKPSLRFIEVLADKIAKPRKRTPKESAIFFKKCRRAAHVLATETNELFRVFVVLK